MILGFSPSLVLIRLRLRFFRVLIMEQSIYRVVFVHQDKVFEIYAQQVFQSDLYGFIEVEEFLFGERSQMIVDPGEDRLKNEFSGVKRSYIPMHSIIRIDEVEKAGQVKVSDNKGSTNVSLFPQGGSPKAG